jgi:hypothetical protein
MKSIVAPGTGRPPPSRTVTRTCLFVSAVLIVIGASVLPAITASGVLPKRLLSPLSVSAAGLTVLSVG